LKSVEIPTAEPFIFLFLVSRSIWWCVNYGFTWWSHPPLNRRCPNILKSIDIPSPTPYISLFLCQGASDGM
jgi:hypothetical protein